MSPAASRCPQVQRFRLCSRLTASEVMEPNLTYVYPHTRVQSLVSILRSTVFHAFPVVTENRQNERDFLKGNVLVSNNVHYKVARGSLRGQEGVLWFRGPSHRR